MLVSLEPTASSEPLITQLSRKGTPKSFKTRLVSGLANPTPMAASRSPQPPAPPRPVPLARAQGATDPPSRAAPRRSPALSSPAVAAEFQRLRQRRAAGTNRAPGAVQFYSADAAGAAQIAGTAGADAEAAHRLHRSLPVATHLAAGATLLLLSGAYRRGCRTPGAPGRCGSGVAGVAN